MNIESIIDKIKNQSATDQEIWAFVGNVSAKATLLYSDVFDIQDAYSGNPEHLEEVSNDIREKIERAISFLRNCQNLIGYHENLDFHYGFEGVIVLLLMAKAYQGCSMPMSKAMEFEK